MQKYLWSENKNGNKYNILYSKRKNVIETEIKKN